jgi:signal transduction histidine kinase
LLSNALKYSPAESRVRFEVRENDRGAIFDIRDDGVGIPKEEQPRLFEAFQRCSNASGVPGHGLGLAIVKRSLDVHGGTISVDSDTGKGTRFEVHVPFAERAA